MGAPYRLLVDGAAASVLARGLADVVLIGADRIAASGDTANKVGSFSLALGRAPRPGPVPGRGARDHDRCWHPDGGGDRDRGARRRRGHPVPWACAGAGRDPDAQPRVRRTPATPDHRDRHRARVVRTDRGERPAG